MFLINKIIPKNPINSQTMSKINQSVTDLLKIFAKNYSSQTQIVIIGNKELEYKQKQKRKNDIEKDKNKKIKYYKKIHGENATIPNIPEIPEKEASLDIKTIYCTDILNLGFKPLFPRGKITPLKSPQLIIELNRYVIRDAEYDPYAAYIIKSSLGKKVAVKERRFKEFERLNMNLKNFLNKDCILPPASSKLGQRNLDENFLKERVRLLNEYLQKIKKIQDVLNDEAFILFIGLYLEDSLDAQIFEEAFKETKFELCIWDDIKYDEPMNAMTKLITRKVWKTVQQDIYISLPKGESARKASLKQAYKIIYSTVQKAVPPLWNVTYDSSKKLRGILQNISNNIIERIIEKKTDINNKIKNKMMDAFDPIRNGISKLFSSSIYKVIPPILGPFAYIYKAYTEKAEQHIIQALYNCDKNIIKKGIDILNKYYQNIILNLKDNVNEQLKIIWKQLNEFVSLKLLEDCLNPMKVIGIILSDFVKILSPDNFAEVAIELFEYKNQLINCNGQGVDKILNEMERNVYSKIENNSFKMDNARYDLKYNIYSLGLDLDIIADICFDLGKKLIKKVYRKTCKKFYRKFSDYVWGFSMRTDDGKSWQEKVNEAIILSYQAARKKFNKECRNIVSRCICDILKGVIINKVIDMIMKSLGDSIISLSDTIPQDIKQMINVENMAKKVIEEILTSILERTVLDQSKSFVEILNQAIENCQIKD